MAAITDMVGRQLATLVVTADAGGYGRLLAWALEQTPSGRLGPTGNGI